ncbi:MAG: acetone carboxylase subunit gamma [Chloroflexi bacterium]|nr:acetone carboxylase subunit gamma [Chloroflexota bacterium]
MAPEDVIHLTPYVDIVRQEGRLVSVCTQCGFNYGDADENFKLGCLVYERDPREVQPGRLGPDKDWMVYREFYCPGCGTQVDVEATAPGMPILHNIQLQL